MPAFSGIARSLDATPVQMQQTLSAYLFGFAFMNLFHGALADSFGRRPVVLWGIGAVHAGLGRLRAVADHRPTGVVPRGAGHVRRRGHRGVARRDPRHVPAGQAQRVMSQVTIYFGVAPAVAPMIGGWLFVHVGWHTIFWFLTAVGVVAVVANCRLLPETLHATQRQPFNVAQPDARLLAARLGPALLAAGAGQRRAVQRHVPLRAVGAGVPGRASCGLAPTQFFWFFC